MGECNGWTKWSEHVLYQIESLNGCVYELREKLSSADIEIARLKDKAKIWGAIGGAIPVAVAILIWLLKDVVG